MPKAQVQWVLTLSKSVIRVPISLSGSSMQICPRISEWLNFQLATTAYRIFNGEYNTAFPYDPNSLPLLQ
jgi:hypothetical protein